MSITPISFLHHMNPNNKIYYIPNITNKQHITLYKSDPSFFVFVFFSGFFLFILALSATIKQHRDKNTGERRGLEERSRLIIKKIQAKFQIPGELIA